MSSSEERIAEYSGIGTASLQHGVSETDDGKPFTIHGVAIGEDDITIGKSQTKKTWPRETLREAAETLEGRPLVKNHTNNAEGRIGTVTNVAYKAGVGVLYEAEIAPHYEQFAKDIQAGILDVSPRIYHPDDEHLEEDPETGALIVSEGVFDNLSVVDKGASPSNSVKPGSSPHLSPGTGDQAIASAGTLAGDTSTTSVATLSEGTDRPDDGTVVDALASDGRAFDDGDWVTGRSSGGSWHGMVRGSKVDGCYSEKIDGEEEICAGDDEPVYLIENYDPASGEFTDTMVAHKEGSISSWDHEENRHKVSIDLDAAELESSMDELDSVYSDWSDAVNMTASDLEQWKEHPCASEASVDPEAVIERNMGLLETDKSDWTTDHIEDAKRTISFISRMSASENEPDDPRDGPNGCPSEWAISLLNWAYNPFDEIPDVPDQASEESASAQMDGVSEMELSPDHEDIYESESDALDRADGLDCEGTHEHEIDGETYYMPCSGHDVYLDMAGDTSESSDCEPCQNASDELAHNGNQSRPTESGAEPVTDGTPEWTEGDLVRWQVEPDLFGTIVHVDEKRQVAMVEIMGMNRNGDSDTMESTGFTITAGYSDLMPMKMPETGTDLAKHGDEDESSQYAEAPVDADVAELAMINDLDINGMVMWGDGMMGVLEDFMETEDGLMVEIAVVTNEDGTFERTGETVTRPIHTHDSMEMEAAESDGGAVAELADYEMHEPDYDGTAPDREWSKPAMEDFDTDDLGEIDDHFVLSSSGFPPENYGDLTLPVVFPDGELSWEGLDSAHAMAKQVEGLSDERAEEIQTMLNELADSAFDDPVSPMDDASDSEMADADATQSLSVPYTVVALRNDDSTDDTTAPIVADVDELLGRQETAVSTEQLQSTQIDMDIEYTEASDEATEELDDPVVIERDEVEHLAEKADEADEFEQRLEELNASIEDLAEGQEILDEIDDEHIEALREHDDAEIVDRATYEQRQEAIDEVGDVYAEALAENDSVLDAEDFRDRWTPGELREKFTEAEETEIEDVIDDEAGDPESDAGTVESEELSEPDDDEGVEETEAVRETVAEELENRGWDRQAQKVRDGDISVDQYDVSVEQAD